MDSVLNSINEVFRELFDDDALTVGRETTASDVQGWDSMNHVRLILNVEKAFRIRFMSSEVSSLKNVGDLVDLIESKTKENANS